MYLRDDMRSKPRSSGLAKAGEGFRLVSGDMEILKIFARDSRTTTVELQYQSYFSK